MLKVTPQLATTGAESAVCQCIVDFVQPTWELYGWSATVTAHVHLPVHPWVSDSWGDTRPSSSGLRQLSPGLLPPTSSRRDVNDVLDVFVRPHRQHAVTEITLGRVKVKVKVRGIAVRNVTSPHRYGNSHAIRDHAVLPATRQRWHSHLYPSRSWYSI